MPTKLARVREPAVRADRFRQSEVAQVDVVEVVGTRLLVIEDVAGFDVAMDEALRVRCGGHRPTAT